jgi:hypothetical protein
VFWQEDGNEWVVGADEVEGRVCAAIHGVEMRITLRSFAAQKARSSG